MPELITLTVSVTERVFFCSALAPSQYHKHGITWLSDDWSWLPVDDNDLNPGDWRTVGLYRCPVPPGSTVKTLVATIVHLQEGKSAHFIALTYRCDDLNPEAARSFLSSLSIEGEVSENPPMIATIQKLFGWKDN
jgi:hypothetical protein